MTKTIMTFERIAVDVVDDIRSGRLNPGDPLPSIKEWKRTYECGYYSVRMARLFLKRRGYAERLGRGVCVTSMAPYL